MSLFKKPKRKFRQRVTHSDSEDDECTKDKSDKNDCNDQQKAKPKAIISTATIIKEEEKNDTNDKKSSTGTKLLSFHDEEDDGEVFKVKKSNYSRRLARRLEKERKKKLEKMEEKQKAEENDNVAPKLQEEPAPSESPDKEESPNILNGEDVEDMDIDSENEEEKKANHPFKNVLKSGVIPDAATIYAMKKHRQMAREMGDFVALDDTRRVQETKSRLIRDDDNDRSDEDDGEEGRLSFTVNVAAVERQKAREAFLSVQEREERDLENDEEADELERWEREQIRKGVGITQLQVNQQQQQEQGEQPLQGTINKSSKLENKPVKLLIPPVTRERKDLTIEAIRTRLSERLSSLQEMYANHQREEDQCHNGLINSYNLISQLEKEGPLLESRFSLYQQMRGYVTDLVECLDIKVAKLELLEHQMNELLKLSAEKLIHRRQQDVRDQADDYSSISSKVLRGSSLDMMDIKTNSQDEAKLRRAAEREGRRMRRRKVREAKSLIVKHHEGMSSDDEETDIDVVKRNNQIESLVEQSEIIFEDVKEEFGTIRGVKANFEGWRRGQPSSYNEAYVSLCLPKLLSPFVRAELLKWNPLEKYIDMEQMVWFEMLIFYGWKDDDTDDIELDDPDLNLLPSIVEKVVLPKLTRIARDVWDPMSTNQTLQLVNLTKRLIEEYPTINGKSKNTQEYLGSVAKRLYKSLDEDVFIPLYPKELLENRLIGAVSFFQRQFWCSVKLIRNILSWQGILSDESLQDLALNCLLNRYLLLALQNSQGQRDTVEKCKTIVSTLPRAWFSQLKGVKTLPQLQMFARILKQFGHSQDETLGKEVIKEYAQMLMTIGAIEEATELSKQFSLGNLKIQSHSKVS